MSVFRKNMHAFIGMVLMVVASSANAALVNYTVTGDVLLGTNPFGLVPGDTITATGQLDDSVLIDGTGSILFGSGSGNTMTINVGNTEFYASHDSDYAIGLPTLHFTGGLLDDFDTFIMAGVNDAPADFSSYLLGFNDGASMYGEWQETVEFSPVPVPAAVWLFGSGLLGLIGFAKHK